MGVCVSIKKNVHVCEGFSKGLPLWLIRDIFSVGLSMRLGKFPNELRNFRTA